VSQACSTGTVLVQMIDIVAIDTPTLGDRGYLATDGEVALVVDAQRDFDRITGLASDRGVTITHVLETHIHNDYVTGGYALAREVGAEYLVSAADPVTFHRTPVHDGDVVEAGRMRVRAIGTPGHTFTHMSYALGDGTADPAAAAAVFTGGSLLNGSTGRTDLLGADNAEELSRAQYDSVRRLARELPGTARVCATHGFGSLCSAGTSQGAPPSSTIDAERQANPALTRSRPKFVAGLLAGLDAYPAYYAHMASANLTGRAEPDLAPPGRADPAKLQDRIEAGEWVVDLRARTAFAADHVRGTLNFEGDGSLATYLGWLMPWLTPLTLLAGSPADITAAQRELCRIGIDTIAAAASGGASDWAAAGAAMGSYRVAAFADVPDREGNGKFVLLDVRRRSEWRAGHLPGAVHIPLPELADRMAELPDREIWVHCQGGYRAAVGASMLAAAGRPVVLIDDDLDAAAGVAG
jgi:hydroxyacylglutathione hydrolase